MTSVAHHLSVTATGRLAEEDDLGAVLGVLRIMAGTMSTHWPHAPWFGLHEAFVEASTRHRRDHEVLRDAINHAFRELGVERYHVASLSSGEGSPDGRRSFDLVIEDAEGRSHFSAVPVL